MTGAPFFRSGQKGGDFTLEKLTKEAEMIMTERFGKDSIIALATTINGIP